MEISKLTQALALGLLLSSNALAEGDDLNRNFSVNGFIAGTSFHSPNNVSHPDVEVGIGAAYQVNDYLGIHGSVGVRDGVSSIDTLFVDLESKVPDTAFSINTQIGKNRSYIGLSNYARFYPAARQFIIPPQGIYWSSMDSLVGSSTGIRTTIKHESGVAFGIAKTSVDIHESKPINESTFIPGKISSAGMTVYGLTYSSRSIYAGAQHIVYEFSNGMQGMFKDPHLTMNLHFIKIHDCVDEVAIEHMDSSSSLNKLDGNQKKQEAYSVSYSRVLRENVKLNLNYNRTTYNHEKELAAMPNKNTTVEKIVGVQFANVGIKNFTVKLEKHFVDGTSWLTSDLNPNGMQGKWSMTAAQAIYEF